MIALYLSLIDSDESKDKFEELYLKYRKQMKKIAFKILGDDGLAEDAVHIRSVSIDIYRKRNREFEKTDILDKEISTETDFSAVQVETVLKAIEALPEIYSDILLLKIEYDYKDKEIAEILGTNVNTVSKRLERARKQLKQQLLKGGSAE